MGKAGRGRVGKEWTTVEPDSEYISWFESQGALPALAFLGEIRVCALEYGISTFDSESFELELNGSAWDTSGLSFVQIPSVVSEIRFRPMRTMSGLP